MKSVAYYNHHAESLSERYTAMDPAIVHAAWLDKYLPEKPGFACDIGAGSGRDANWLAAKGWDVIAVEPSDEMRAIAEPRSHPNVTWLDDTLPQLEKLRALGHRFDLVLLSAVWMHLPPGGGVRERAFRIVSELLQPSGTLVITLRHGTDEQDNRERSFHAVSAAELQQFAKTRALAFSDSFREPDPIRKQVTWETLVFSMPDDGTGTLPLLRHIIVNDDKSASYKLGLLRVLTRIAESLPGIVIARGDDHVDIPLGVVGLYWLKQYKPLILQHQIPQIANPNLNPGFATENFHKLANVSSSDLRIGATLTAETAAIVTSAIRDACRNITKMPVRFTTFPGTDNAIFQYEWKTRRTTARPVVISRDYLAEFGTFRLPRSVWQTMGQYACWLEPAILREWMGLTDRWGVIDYKPYDISVFDWEESRRDTTIAARQVATLRESGHAVPCVWSARNPKTLHIDHCFPWARWLNNDLWNLLPASASVNSSKGDKLPSAQAMASAKGRIVQWWESAYLETPLREKFLLEAESSLPHLVGGEFGVEEMFRAVLFQRARLKVDQGVVEWGLGV